MTEAAKAFTNSKWAEQIGSPNPMTLTLWCSNWPVVMSALFWVTCLTLIGILCRTRSLCSNTVDTGKKRSWGVNVCGSGHGTVAVLLPCFAKKIIAKPSNKTASVSWPGRCFPFCINLLVFFYGYLIFKRLVVTKWECEGVSITLPAIKIRGPYTLINIFYRWPSARLQ